jgi:asparaginyl-tRNA synthetase
MKQPVSAPDAYHEAVPVVSILEGKHSIGTCVTVRGWLRTRRDSKAGFSFLALYDGSCFHTLQVVVDQNLPNYQPELLRLTTGCSLSISGRVTASPAQGQSVELRASEVTVTGWVEEPEHYPLAAKRHSMEHLREMAHLRPRTNVIGAVARVRHTLAQAIHRFFDHHGFFWVATPIITTADCEGGGELFRVSTLDHQQLPHTADNRVDFSQDFFGQEAFLTVSGQLNAESYACALSKVYTFGPTFRAENSNTSRHLAEFWMVEPEVAFADLTAIASLAEALLKYVVTALLNQREAEIDFFTEGMDSTVRSRLEQLIDSSFIQLDYREAIAILQRCGQSFEHPVAWGIDLAAEHERYLVEQHCRAPVIVKNYPKAIKAFYMRLNSDGETVAAMDVLAPGIGEIIGGSQREERLESLDQRLAALALDPRDYGWYRDLRRYGTVPHAGFGLGFERLLLYVTGLQNIRDAIPFPRTPRHAQF